MFKYLNHRISNLVGVAVIIAVVIFTFGGVFAYQYFQKSQTPMTNVQSNYNVQNSNETADWKTYSNPEYGFEIKYPKEWFLEPYFGDSGKDTIYISKSEPAYLNGLLEVTIMRSLALISLEKEVEVIYRSAQSDTGVKISFTQENVSIGGEGGLRVKTICKENENFSCGAPEWYVIKNNYLYHFMPKLGSGPIIDQIISTFKFKK